MNRPPLTLHGGDVVLAAFPFTDLSGNKRRPAVTLASATDRADLLLAFISSVLPLVPLPSDQIFQPSDVDFVYTGLKVPSVLRLNKIATIAQHLVTRRIVTRRIGHLTMNQLLVLDDKLSDALGINVNRHYTRERRRLADLFQQQGLEVLLREVQIT